MDLGIANVAAITAICMVVGYGVKCSKLDSKFIPLIVAIAGGIIGVIAFYIKMPDFPADNIITAIAVGIASGLAGTGVNQMFKQLSGNTESSDTNSNG